MKPTAINKIVKTILFAGVCEMGLAIFPTAINLARATEPASAAVTPQVIEVTAKKFEFTPKEITIKKGEPVILRLTSADRVHGFMSKPLGFDTDITPGKPTDVAVTANSSGQYTVICDHYCGTGHGGMKLKVTVVE
jgi:cytochrome c oxidase subunit 2